MLPADADGDPLARTPADNQTVRNVFVIGPDKKIKLILVYPMTTGRNFDEVLRVIDSLQLTAKHKVATPVNWKQGEDVIIAGSVSDEQAKEIFGELGRAAALHPDRPAAVRAEGPRDNYGPCDSGSARLQTPQPLAQPGRARHRPRDGGADGVLVCRPGSAAAARASTAV